MLLTTLDNWAVNQTRTWSVCVRVCVCLCVSSDENWNIAHCEQTSDVWNTTQEDVNSVSDCFSVKTRKQTDRRTDGQVQWNNQLLSEVISNCHTAQRVHLTNAYLSYQTSKPPRPVAVAVTSTGLLLVGLVVTKQWDDHHDDRCELQSPSSDECILRARHSHTYKLKFQFIYRVYLIINFYCSVNQRN